MHEQICTEIKACKKINKTHINRKYTNQTTKLSDKNNA
jgi:hypothetical protein